MTRSVRVALSLLGAIALAAVLSAQTVRYIYDELGRLVGVIDASGDAAVYHYDAVGNLLSITRSTSTQVSVIEFTPNAGPIGQSVTIYGTGFSASAGQNTVSFNGTTASISSASTTTLIVTVPSGATTGTIAVTSPNGSANSATSRTMPLQRSVQDRSASVKAAARVALQLSRGRALQQKNVEKNQIEHKVAAQTALYGNGRGSR
jgi:YD repeat-containing protein